MSGSQTLSERRTWFLALLFLLSGTAALLAELSWSRQVGGILGHTANVNALVLMAYFTGLAGGQWLGRRIGKRQPLHAYALAELLTSIGTACVPLWLRIAEELSPPWATVVCFVSLVPPTLTLGMTFPLIITHCTRTPATRERRTLQYYTLNTLGGVVGVVLTVSVCLPFVGVRGSNHLAAGIAAACGVFAWCLAPRSSSSTVSALIGPSPVAWRWLAVATFSGGLTLALQVLYTRLFALVLHNSTYTFAALLAVILGALALGSWLTSKVLRHTTPWRLVMWVSACTPVALAVSVLLFAWLTRFEYLTTRDSFAPYMLHVFGLVTVVVLPPIALQGMLFPAALAADGHSGTAAARLAFVNLAAGAFGAFAAGFLLLPHGGLWISFSVVVLFSGLPALRHRLARRQFQGATGLLVAVVVMALVVVRGPETMLVNATTNEVVLAQWDSAYGRIDVVQDQDSGSLRLRQNLHYRHGSTLNAAREYRQGRMPLLLHPSPTEVAFIGLGTGITAAPLVRDRRVEQAVIVELIPEVIQAARYFRVANLGVCDDPKTTLVRDDARHYFRTTPKQFDVVVADLFVPWETRSGYLYTVDFYKNVRQRLKQGGLFCQWLALYQLGSVEFEMIADSFASVFPNVTLWWGQLDGRYPILALCGSDTPLVCEPKAVGERFAASRAFPKSAVDFELARPADLSQLYIGRWLSRASQFNTDERPRLEFRAPLSQQGQTLAGQALRDYFERVLGMLPADDFPVVPSAPDRRVAQRLALFGTYDDP